MTATRKKVLVVDDEEDFATLSAVRIEEAGYDVFTETDGDKVLTRVEEIKPDLLVLDVMLQANDGLSILKKLKKEVSDMPIIIVTGKAVIMNEIFALEGSSGFFKKPVDIKALVKRIKELIGNNQ